MPGPYARPPRLARPEDRGAEGVDPAIRVLPSTRPSPSSSFPLSQISVVTAASAVVAMIARNRLSSVEGFDVSITSCVSPVRQERLEVVKLVVCWRTSRRCRVSETVADTADSDQCPIVPNAVVEVAGATRQQLRVHLDGGELAPAADVT